MKRGNTWAKIRELSTVCLIIVQGLLDRQGKPFSADGTRAVSRVMHTKTIDGDSVRFLDGADKKICMINK